MAEAIERIKEQALEQLKASSIYQSSIAWFTGLAPRDQTLVKALSIMVALALLITWTWQPSQTSVVTSNKRLASELKFHQNMKENAFLFSNSSANKGGSFKGSILSLVNNTAKAKKIVLKRFEPEGNTGLRIWLDQANFNSVIDWLEVLETQKGITIEQISIDKVNPGIVNLRAVLKA